MLVNKNINNISGGVSQQNPANRFDNQVEFMENFLITVAQGLRKRNPLEQVNTVSSGNFSENMAIHSYDRGDGKEKYGMIFDNNGIRVFDDLGIEKTVSIVGANPLSVWQTSNDDWSSKLKFLTVGDTTWILNKDQVVSYDSPDDLIIENKAFYWIKKTTTVTYGSSNASFKGYNYEIVLDGTSYSAYDLLNPTLAEGEDPVEVDTTDSISVINSFAESISGNTTNRFYCKPSGSILMIIKGDYTSIAEGGAFAISEGYNNEYMIKISETSDGADPEYYDMTDNSDRASALSKLTQGWYLSTGTTETFERLIDLTEYSSAYTDAVLLKPLVRYYSSSNYHYSGALTVAIQHYNNGSTFTFASGDSFGNQASSGWQDNVSKLSDLPVDMYGFDTYDVGTIAITGTDRDNFTNYYLTWDSEDNRWVETYRPDTKIIIDPTTMPAKLIRQADGTFAFGFNIEDENYDGFGFLWDERIKGDEDSNPTPSFLGSTIENMFFFKNRLGFTSNENVILSETSAYYNFFATTAMEVLDSDPIDVTIDSNTVSIIRNINVVGNAVTLWADNAQFLLSGGEVLSPATTRVSQTSSYACENSIPPIAVDNEIMFFNKIGEHLTMSSYSSATLQSDKTDAEELTSHVPEYLPNTIKEVVCSPSHNLMFFKASDDDYTIYVYKYFIKNKQRIISSWFKWTFSDRIRSIEVLGYKLFLLCNDNDILSMDLEPKALDQLFLDKGNVGYEANVLLSSFNVQTRQETQVIREPFYIKNIKIKSEGLVDFYVLNKERLDTNGDPKVVVSKNKHLDRKLFIGGNSEKTNIGFSSSYNTGCRIDVVNIEGRIKTRSRNV